MPQRRDYIDELKGLGILLVVLGHFIEQYRMGYSFVSASFFCIYAFHMALFCICSGLVARFNPRKLVTQQLWLYLVGQTLMLAFRAAVLRENFAETGGLLAAWLLPWRHIWYLYALIFWHLTLPVLCRLRDRLGLAGSCLGMALAVGLALAAGLVDWPFTLVRVFAFYPFYACGVLLRPQLDRLAAFAAEHRPVRLVAAAGLVLGYGAYFLWVLRADPIMDHSAELFHDVSYAGGDRVQYRVVFYLVGIATTAVLTVLASRRHLLAGLGRHTLAIYLLHLPVQALLVELGLYDLMRGKATIVVVLWSVLLAAVTLAVLNLSPVQRACDAVANCWWLKIKLRQPIQVIASLSECRFYTLFYLESNLNHIYKLSQRRAVAHVTVLLLFVESKNQKLILVKIKAFATATFSPFNNLLLRNLV